MDPTIIRNPCGWHTYIAPLVFQPIPLYFLGSGIVEHGKAKDDQISAIEREDEVGWVCNVYVFV